MNRLALVIFMLLLPLAGRSANKYLRQGASGAANGNNWTDAYTTWSAAQSGASRGDTIYVADTSSSLGSVTFDKATSGTTLLTVKKATVADHGTSTGWSDAYGDGQAEWGEIGVYSDYWVIDGQTRNESNWQSGSEYGFKAAAVTSIDDLSSLFAANHVTVKHVTAGGAEGTTLTGSEPDTAYKLSGFRALATDWTFTRCRGHNIAHYAVWHMNGTDSVTIEYCSLDNSWGKEAIRGQIAFKNGVIRFNQFINAGGTASPDACTAEIALWDGSSGTFDNNKIYGNIFWRSRGGSDFNTGGTIVVGGNNNSGGDAWAGSPANNTLIYNNTIAGIQGTESGGTSTGGRILVNGGTGNEVRNTLWYDINGTPGASANTTSNNGEESSNPFVNYATGNFHLSAGIAGTSLSSPYNLDMEGTTRGGDGTFDRGALEYGSGADTNAPGLTSATFGTSGTTLTLAFDESVTIGAGGNGGWSVTLSGGSVTLTYASGSGSSSLVYNCGRVVYAGETLSSGLNYTQPGNGVEDSAGNDLATITNHAIVNNSTQTSGTGSNFARVKVNTLKSQ